jgi:predicted secreted protein
VRAEGIPASAPGLAVYQNQSVINTWYQEQFNGTSNVFIGTPGTVHWDFQWVSGGAIQVTSYDNVWQFSLIPALTGDGGF